MNPCTYDQLHQQLVCSCCSATWLPCLPSCMASCCLQSAVHSTASSTPCCLQIADGALFPQRDKQTRYGNITYLDELHAENPSQEFVEVSHAVPKGVGAPVRDALACATYSHRLLLSVWHCIAHHVLPNSATSCDTIFAEFESTCNSALCQLS